MSGTLTFLFTDIEGSSRLWERFPSTMGRALARHDEILRLAADRHGGFVFKTVGDAFCIAFQTASAAVLAALEAQGQLAAEPWHDTGPLKVRMGLHTGPAEHRNGDYFGPALNRASRIVNAGHGGQTLLCHITASLVRPVLPAGIALRELGVIRLRNLEELERVFQLIDPALPDVFPPLRSLEETPNNLPARLTTFIGRERELAELARLARSARLVTLTGPGGTGKTRLLLETAFNALDEFHDGAWLVELATLTDPDLVPATASAAIGLRENPDQDQTLLDFFRKRHALLLIDNCEHLLDACARLAGDLLRHCPRLHILATSRSPLGIGGEAAFPVPTLSMPDLWGKRTLRVADPVAEFGAYESVRLFVERARAARPSFALTAANAATVARICWRLDGIPHAIELAAARIKILTPDRILERLDDRFNLLTGGSRTGLPHQQTLRTMMDWSYDLLSEPEQALLARLSVFGRGRSLEAIEDVCAGDPVQAPQILDLLGQLVDKSLISTEEDAFGEPRYYMLESLWEYARSKLAGRSELESYRDRHLDFFVRLAERAEPRLEQRDQAEWLDRLSAEHGNLRLTIDWSRQTRHGPEPGMRLVSALTRYWEVRSRLQEGRDHFEAVLAHPGAAARTALRAKTVAGAGRLAWCQDDDHAARRLYDEALGIARELGDEAAAGILLTFLGFVDRTEGKTEDAARRFAEGLEIGTRLGNQRITVVALSGQGSLASDSGDYERARDLKEQALQLYREIGDKWVLGLLSWSFARVALAHGDHTRAEQLYTEFAQIGEELGNRWSFPYVLEGLAEIALARGRLLPSATLFGASEAMLEKLGLSRSASEKALYERTLARLRAALPPAELEAAWKEGRGLSPAAARALVQSSGRPAPEAAPNPP